jgi:hypothetical protein
MPRVPVIQFFADGTHVGQARSSGQGVAGTVPDCER